MAAQHKVEGALRDLYKRHGRLDPVDVVEAARDPRSVLHNRFEWNDTEAAAKWRLEQARNLIRSVKIEVEVGPKEPPRIIRLFVHDSVNDGYLTVQDVVTQKSVRDQILEDMRADLERLKKKWKLYEDTFTALAAEVLAVEIGEATASTPEPAGS